jgi:hypothetical protein
MNKYQYVLEFESDSTSVAFVMKLMQSMIPGTLEEIQAVNVRQTLTLVDAPQDDMCHMHIK